jgi:hypothetical protein
VPRWAGTFAVIRSSLIRFATDCASNSKLSSGNGSGLMASMIPSPRHPVASHHCGDRRWHRACGPHGHRRRQGPARFVGRAGGEDWTLIDLRGYCVILTPLSAVARLPAVCRDTQRKGMVMALCIDPAVTYLRGFGFNVVRLPRASIQALDLLGQADGPLIRLGPLSDVITALAVSLVARGAPD